MKRPKQLPYDLILWSLVSLNGKAEWTELRKRAKLKTAELDAVLGELVKDGKGIDHTLGNSVAKPSHDPAQVGMKCKTLEPVLCATQNLSLSEVHIELALTFAPPSPPPNIPEALPFYL